MQELLSQKKYMLLTKPLCCYLNQEKYISNRALIYLIEPQNYISNRASMQELLSKEKYISNSALI